MNGLVGGLENGLAGGFLGFFCFFETFNRGEHPNVPAVGTRLTAAGKAVRRGKATIYRDLFMLADAFARCTKANSPAAENVSVVVALSRKSYYHTLITESIPPELKEEIEDF